MSEIERIVERAERAESRVAKELIEVLWRSILYLERNGAGSFGRALYTTITDAHWGVTAYLLRIGRAHPKVA